MSLNKSLNILLILSFTGVNVTTFVSRPVDCQPNEFTNLGLPEQVIVSVRLVVFFKRLWL